MLSPRETEGAHGTDLKPQSDVCIDRPHGQHPSFGCWRYASRGGPEMYRGNWKSKYVLKKKKKASQKIIIYFWIVLKMPPLSLENIQEKSICMGLLSKWHIKADLIDAYVLSRYKLLTSGRVSQVGAHPFTAYIPNKITKHSLVPF